MASEVVILGGGVGGTLCANLVARQAGEQAHVTVVDATGVHVYQPGFLYVAVGNQRPAALQHPEASPPSICPNSRSEIGTKRTVSPGCTCMWGSDDETSTMRSGVLPIKRHPPGLCTG